MHSPDSFLNGYIGDVDPSAVAMDYAERNRHREEAKLIYDMIRKGEIPNPGEETMKHLMDQISGIRLEGV